MLPTACKGLEQRQRLVFVGVVDPMSVHPKADCKLMRRAAPLLRSLTKVILCRPGRC